MPRILYLYGYYQTANVLRTEYSPYLLQENKLTQLESSVELEEKKWQDKLHAKEVELEQVSMFKQFGTCSQKRQSKEMELGKFGVYIYRKLEKSSCQKPATGFSNNSARLFLR